MSLLKIRAARSLPKLKGSIFAIFDRDSIATRHPLDTQQDEYKSVVSNYVIPACKQIVPASHSYHERLGDVVEYNNPAFDMCWNFKVELTYRIVAPEKEQTVENLTLMRILRAAMDIDFTMTAIIDDIADGAESRNNKPAWHTFCDGGQMAAVYDAMVFSHLPSFLIRHFFKDAIGYGQMLETIAKATLHTLIGQNMDLLSRNNFSHDMYSMLRSYKTAKFFQIGPALGLLHAKITDRQLIQSAEDIFYNFGIAAQTWDDFLDVYGPAKVTGKTDRDSATFSTTWVSTTAIKHFDREQLVLFKECYGSQDPEKQAILKRLYDEINLPLIYLKDMYDLACHIHDSIARLPNEKLRYASTSYTEWCLGSVEEMKALRLFIDNYSK